MKRGDCLSRVKFDRKEVNKAFNELYELYVDSIYRFCLSKLDCDEHYAQDCTQETFLVLYKRLKQGDSFENPRAFLYQTALNYIRRRYDIIKKEQKNLTQLGDVENVFDSTENKIIETVDFEIFSKRLQEMLSDDEKLLLQLRFEQDLKVTEIAEQLGITQANCYVRIMRLRQKIIGELQDFI